MLKNFLFNCFYIPKTTINDDDKTIFKKKPVTLRKSYRF